MLIGTFDDWKRAYHEGADPALLLEQQRQAFKADDTAWISIASADQLHAQLQSLEDAGSPARAGPAPTVRHTVCGEGQHRCGGLCHHSGLPCFCLYRTGRCGGCAAPENAGAIVLGKTNLDQFATGLVGTRSPYGVVPNTWDETLISGGSSSGSASVVARGLVPFALSTDTAGSGRVPAAFNQIVGLKPTPGAVPSTGLVPACRTLDCIGRWP